MSVVAEKLGEMIDMLRNHQAPNLLLKTHKLPSAEIGEWQPSS